jgi:Reverse transcriptase (RNA-dependent DNA polymerase)
VQFEVTVPTLKDRVVQMALKLVMEPIFEADFYTSSYAYRPGRRAQDAIAEIYHFAHTPSDYEWVVEADVEACFDRIDHAQLMGEVARRIGDKRVLLLVRSFLKAGMMMETGHLGRTVTGTPQGGIASPPFWRTSRLRPLTANTRRTGHKRTAIPATGSTYAARVLRPSDSSATRTISWCSSRARGSRRTNSWSGSRSACRLSA